MKRFQWKVPSQWVLIHFDENIFLLVMAIIVGLLSGLAAVFLNLSLHFCSEHFDIFRQYWWCFFLPGLGAACSSVFLKKIIKDDKGHGVPDVIYSVSRDGGFLKLRSVFSRLIASTLTIGSGGSAGPEAPIVISGASIGSNIARLFSLNERQRITLLGCGSAAAISAIFNAPVAGIIFTLEVILAEWNTIYLVPVAISSVAGTELSRFLTGDQIPFSNSGFNIGFHDLAAAAVLAVVTALVSVFFTRIMEKNSILAEKTWKKLKLPFWLKAGTGGCIVGVMGYFIPDAMGEGYHCVRELIGGIYQNGLTIVAIVLLAKIAATSFTIGWGGSGGIFAPSLVIGSLTGVLFYRCMIFIFPGISLVGEGGFALLGMSGVMGGVLQAPLTGIFLIVEITGGYEVIVPLIMVSTLSSTICRYLEPASLYLKELVLKGELLRPGTDARVLADLKVEELIEKDCMEVYNDMLLKDVISMLKVSKRNFFPVINRKNNEYLGIVHLDDIRPFLMDNVMYQTVFVYQIMNSKIPSVSKEIELKKALDIMDAYGYFSLPVLDGKIFIGIISKGTLLDQYRRELMVQTSEL
ncbi:MAG: chloride channel protein [Deltaproteobacteria bacterium]|nr:MAG: chloride channel protein [Deltaproteobacteria bacterium]